MLEFSLSFLELLDRYRLGLGGFMLALFSYMISSFFFLPNTYSFRFTSSEIGMMDPRRISQSLLSEIALTESFKTLLNSCWPKLSEFAIERRRELML